MEVKWEALVNIQLSIRQSNWIQVKEIPSLSPNSYLGKAYITLTLFLE
jgi:hypothetical protein